MNLIYLFIAKFFRVVYNEAEILSNVDNVADIRLNVRRTEHEPLLID